MEKIRTVDPQEMAEEKVKKEIALPSAKKLILYENYLNEDLKRITAVIDGIDNLIGGHKEKQQIKQALFERENNDISPKEVSNPV